MPGQNLGQAPEQNSSRSRRPSIATSVENQLKELDEQLREQPDDINLLKAKAILLQSQANIKIQNGDREGGYADYENSGETWRKIKLASPSLASEDADEFGTAIYNLACALSLRNEIEPAVLALREAVEAGFSQLDLIDTDSDLTNLRESVSFKTFLADLPELRHSAAKRHIAEETLFPFEFSLPNFDDKTISTSDYTGKVVIVDFWGTWCGPCRQEIPSLVALHEKYRDSGLELVGVNYERETDPAKRKSLVKACIDESKISYECVIGDELTQQRIPGFSGYPTTLFLDRKGRVRAKFEGAQSYAMLESVAELLLSEPSEAVNEDSPL